MIQRSFIPKRTIHYRDVEPTWAIELLRALYLLTTVMEVLPFVKIVVLEFYVNLTKEMGDQASLLAYFLCSNEDRQASVTAALALLDSIVPARPSPTPSVSNASTQPAGSGDAECFRFFRFQALNFPSLEKGEIICSLL